MSDPTKVSRRLVAVFAADVEGYSRLMGADEVGTLKGLTERRAILDHCDSNWWWIADFSQLSGGLGRHVIGLSSRRHRRPQFSGIPALRSPSKSLSL
jgi:hypothetical protein